MKKVALSGLLLIVSMTLISGQASNDSIIMKKVFGGYNFYQNNTKLNYSQLYEIMQSNEQAYKQIKAARSTNAFVSIFAGAGGFLIGYPIGTAIGGGDPNWVLAGVGAGLVLIAIPISIKCINQTKNAVNIYNSGLRTSSVLPPAELKFGVTGNGIGFRLNF
jgi:hypothetical protein